MGMLSMSVIVRVAALMRMKRLAMVSFCCKKGLCFGWVLVGTEGS